MSEVNDIPYWSSYYEANLAPKEPSPFAAHVLNRHIYPGQLVVELGSGNGRDARYLAGNGVDVIAVDQCAEDAQEENLLFMQGDFTRLDDIQEGVDAVYSRFTLHSVDAEGQNDSISWAYRNLREGGVLCVEVRGKQNELYGVGEPVDGEDDAFIHDGHYRRFIDLGGFLDQLTCAGFSIEDASEATGCAPFEGTDYHFIRVIAQKPSREP